MSTVGKAFLVVEKSHLAPAMKTGNVNVLSTAIMAALMEEAACNAIPKDKFQVGQTTVGIKLDLSHKKPSALGARVEAVANLVNFNEKKLEFDIDVFDETGLVGSAKHLRAFVMKDIFEKNCAETSKKARGM